MPTSSRHRATLNLATLIKVAPIGTRVRNRFTGKAGVVVGHQLLETKGRPNKAGKRSTYYTEQLTVQEDGQTVGRPLHLSAVDLVV